MVLLRRGLPAAWELIKLHSIFRPWADQSCPRPFYLEPWEGSHGFFYLEDTEKPEEAETPEGLKIANAENAEGAKIAERVIVEKVLGGFSGE